MEDKLAFKPEVIMMPVENLVPIRTISDNEAKGSRYLRIESSIKEIGIIEPLMIFRTNGVNGPFSILDGHCRYTILKAMGKKEAPCLFASRDDTFTYNSRISEVTAIQEHYMIAKAIEQGVSRERIATTLNVVVKDIAKKEKLLEGICPAAVEQLKTAPAKPATIRVLSNVKPERQVEIVNLMGIAGNYTLPYAKSLVAGTPESKLVNPEIRKEWSGLKATDLDSMEKEMEDLGKQIDTVDGVYSRNVLNLVLATGYIKSLLNNPLVVRRLDQDYREFLAEFQKIVDSTSLEA